MASLLPEPLSFRTTQSGDPESRFDQLRNSPMCNRTSDVRACARPGMTKSVMILKALGQLVDILRRPARHFHAEVKTHLGQHFLDLVQRLEAEARSTQHFRFRLLH